MLQKILSSLAILFFAFIIWIIYLANTASDSIFFEWVKIIPYGDKLGHFFLFGILTLAFNLLFKLRCIRIGKYQLYLGSIIVSLFVLIEELSQSQIPSRTLDLQDLFADALGIALFSFISYWISNHSTLGSKIKNSR